MKWYYFYEQNRRHWYDIPLWNMPTKMIQYWLEIFHKHVNTAHWLSRDVLCENVYEVGMQFPCNPQPRFSLRVKAYWRMRRWIKLFEAELARRENPEYRAFINGILHTNQPHNIALAFADWLDENGKYVTARQVRRWVEEEEGKKQRKIKISDRGTYRKAKRKHIELE